MRIMITNKSSLFFLLSVFFVVFNNSAHPFYLTRSYDVDHIIDSLYDAGQYEKCKNEILANKLCGLPYTDTTETVEKLASCYSYLHNYDSAIILLDYLYLINARRLDIGLSYNHLYFHDLIVANKTEKYDSMMKADYQRNNKGKNTALGIELFDLIRKDQEPRNIPAYVEKIEKNGGHAYTKIDSAYWAQVGISDEKNMRQAAAIIDKYGYPGRSMVGILPSFAVQIVIRHSDLKHMAGYLPILKSAAEKGELDRGSIEYMEDRMLILQGKEQLYGTQFCMDSTIHQYSLCPMEDPAHLQDRLKKAELLYPVR